jgi:hypothetical protein
MLIPRGLDGHHSLLFPQRLLFLVSWYSTFCQTCVLTTGLIHIALLGVRPLNVSWQYSAGSVAHWVKSSVPNMLALDTPLSYAAAFAVGVAAHLLLFSVGDWDLAGINVVLSFAVLDLALAGILFVTGESQSNWQALSTSSTLISWIIVGIFISLLVYRAAFHRLNRFPGPFAARLSALHAVALHAKSGHLHHEIRALHAKYGDVIRVGRSL